MDSTYRMFDGISAWIVGLISKNINYPFKFFSFPACVVMCTLLQYWTDIYLSWNPESYPGVQNLRFPSSLIWMPDILLYNRLDTFYILYGALLTS